MLQSELMNTTEPLNDCCDEIGAEAVAAARAALPDDATAVALATIFKALSDPTRVRIMLVLAHGAFCVSDLAAALEMSQSAVSHQLSDLRELHLVRAQREGRHIFYQLDDNHIERLFAVGLEHVKHG